MRQLQIRSFVYRQIIGGRHRIIHIQRRQNGRSIFLRPTVIQIIINQVIQRARNILEGIVIQPFSSRRISKHQIKRQTFPRHVRRKAALKLRFRISNNHPVLHTHITIPIHIPVNDLSRFGCTAVIIFRRTSGQLLSPQIILINLFLGLKNSVRQITQNSSHRITFGQYFRSGPLHHSPSGPILRTFRHQRLHLIPVDR